MQQPRTFVDESITVDRQPGMTVEHRNIDITTLNSASNDAAYLRTLSNELQSNSNIVVQQVGAQVIKEDLVIKQSNETVRQAPIVHEKHVFHEQPVLQERHIYKEVPIINRTVVHEQPTITTREVIHEIPITIKQSEVVKEDLTTQHETQTVKHELRVEEDVHAPKIAGLQAGMGEQVLKEKLVVQKTEESVREAPLINEHHVYHEKPVLQEHHIYKEVPVVDRTVVHEQPSLTTRDVIHELPVQIKESAVVTETVAPIHETQTVKHELRVIEDAPVVMNAGVVQNTTQQHPTLERQNEVLLKDGAVNSLTMQTEQMHLTTNKDASLPLKAHSRNNSLTHSLPRAPMPGDHTAAHDNNPIAEAHRLAMERREAMRSEKEEFTIL